MVLSTKRRGNKGVQKKLLFTASSENSEKKGELELARSPPAQRSVSVENQHCDSDMSGEYSEYQRSVDRPRRYREITSIIENSVAEGFVGKTRWRRNER